MTGLLALLRTHRYALAAAGTYLVFGVAWVLASDYVIATLADDPRLLSRLQSAKGSVFILLSAVAIYFMIRLPARGDVVIAAPGSETTGERPPLRLQLLLLTAATTLPLVALLAYNVQREARRDIDSAAESAQNLARLIATDAARLVRDTHVLADGLAERPGVRALDPARCDPQIAEMTRLVTHVANAITVRRDGSVACSAVPQDVPVNFTEFPLFQRVMQTGRGGVGRLARGPITGRWVVPLASLLRDNEGAVAGAIVLALDATRLTPLIAAPDEDARFITVLDGAGNVMMRVPDAGYVGRNAAESDIARTALRYGDGRGRARGLAGNDQIFGYARVEGTDWIAIASVPARTALRASRESAARSAVLGALVVLATLAVAYMAGRRIERPLRAIASTARSVAEGNLAARAPVSGSLETADIASQLNRLLDRLPMIESKLRASERRLSLVLRAAQEGIVVTDAERVITFANEAAARLLGFRESSELLGERLPNVLPDAQVDEGDDPRRLPERPVDRGDRYELRLHARDGATRWLFVSATPLRGDTGAVEGALAMLYDVTERKEVEERLTRVTRLYWALSEVNEAIVRTAERDTLLAETCRIVVQEGGFASAVAMMLDASANVLVPAASAGSLRFEPLSIAESDASSRSPMAAAIRTGEPQIVNDVALVARTIPALSYTADASVRAIAAFPLRSEDRIVGTLAVQATESDYFDIGLTELLRQVADDVSFALGVYERAAARDRAEAAVRELNAELERRVAERTARLMEANQELEAFSYTVSHDLRAPVRAVNGFARILQDHAGGTLDAEAQRLLGNIIRASAHMGRLIDDLLALAQLGRSAVDLRAVALKPIVDRILESHRTTLEECGGEVVVESLPDVVGEPTLLHQVFANLVGNAIEYRKDGEPLRVSIAGRVTGERVEIVVADNGIGIAPAHHRQIFEPFVRLHAASARPGTGIGLALVAKAVALMRGEIAVDSSEGGGSTFRVTLQAARDPDDRASPAPPAAA